MTTATRSTNAAGAVAILCVVGFAALLHWPVFATDKTVSAFDASYLFGAYADLKPAAFERPSNLLLTDPVVQFQPWDIAMYEGKLGSPHLWNPYAGFGSPLLANGQSAAFFPLKVAVYALFGVRKGFGVLALAKMALAGILMWLYLRVIGLHHLSSLLGSLAFMTSGFMVVWLQWPHTNVALLLPLLFVGCEYLLTSHERRGYLAIAAALGLGILGGHPETLFQGTFSAGLYLLCRATMVGARKSPGELLRIVGWYVFGVVTGASLAALQLFPTLEYIAKSSAIGARLLESQQLSRALSIFSAPDFEHIYKEFLTYLVPNTFGNPKFHTTWWDETTNFNESAGYVGIGVFLLSLFSWRYARRVPQVAALLVLQLLSVGFIFDLPALTKTLGSVPPFDLSENKRFLLIFCFCNSALAALALQEWRRARRIAWREATGLILLAGALTTLVVQRYLDFFADSPNAWFRDFGLRSTLHFAAFLLLSGAALAALRSRNRAIQAAAGVVLVASIAADLYHINFGYNPFIDARQLYPETPAIEFLQTREQPRVLPLGAHIGPNILSRYGVEDPRIYDALTYSPVSDYLQDMQARPTWHLVATAPTPLSSAAGVRYLWSEPGWAPTRGRTSRVFQSSTQRIYEDLDARPHAYLVSSWKLVDDPDSARAALLSADSSDNLVLIEQEAGGAPAEERADGESTPRIRRADAVRRTPDTLEVTLPDTEGGMLVVNDTYYPGWRAFIDGSPAPILRANGAFRGVRVPAGARSVSFAFEPISFRLGAWASAATVGALVVVGLVRSSARSPRGGKERAR